MKLSTYNDIVKTIKECPDLSLKCAKQLIKKYPEISSNTLYSILGIICISSIRSRYGVLMKSASYNARRFIQNEIGADGFVLKEAEQLSLPPALLIKHLLEKYNSLIPEDKRNTKAALSKFLKNTTFIDDKHLAYEAFLCTLYDSHYGPISDAISSAIGYEYEVKLRKHMEEHKIAYVDEEHLRSRGYDKTPDIKLEVPIAVDGVVINWIESKARFGSAEVHKQYMQQFCSYWNRFGPGLVIYWFDFLEQLSQQNEQRFIIMNDFPKTITHIKVNSAKVSFL